MTALITGASSGIGEACARLFAGAGYDLILVARREERLSKIASDLREAAPKVHVQTFALDVRKASDVKTFAAKLDVKSVSVLINNAGLAKGVEKIQDADIADWDAMIDTNVKGLLYLTRALLPAMIESAKNAASGQGGAGSRSRAGHIVNLGSVAGRWVYPGGGVYCASKFAVRALSEGLRMDLMGTGIRVTNIEPGMVETEFSEVRLGDAAKAKGVYKGMTPLSAADVAETILWCVQRPKHVNVQELVLFPTDQAGMGLVHRHD